MSPQPFGTLKGFAVTFRQVFKKPITQQYPEFKRPVYPRFRGRHRLCTGTRTGSRSASAARSARPPAPPTASASSPTRTRRTTASRPASATHGSTRSTSPAASSAATASSRARSTRSRSRHEFELAEYIRDDLIYTKDMLLAEPVKRMPVADRDLYDTPDARLEGGELTRSSSPPRPATSSSGSSGSLAALALLASGLAVVLFPNPFYSALALIGNLGSLAVLYLLLSARVRRGARRCSSTRAQSWSCSSSSSRTSAGAPTRPGPAARRSRPSPRRRGGGDRRSRSSSPSLSRRATASSTRPTITSRSARPAEIGELFLSDHLLAFEVTSIVLLVAAVGGVILGSAMPSSDEESEA